MKRLFNSMDEFHKVEHWLKSHGFKVKVENLEEGLFAIFEGRGVKGGFHQHVPEDPAVYYHINGKICFNNKNCFQHWYNCPYSKEFPKTSKEFEVLLNSLIFWGSSKGRIAYESMEYINDKYAIYR